MDETLTLILPDRPDEEDIILCQDQIEEIRFLFEEPGVLTQAKLAPFVQNLVKVSAELLHRAKLAKSRFLDKPTKVDLDFVQLGTTIKQISRLHQKVLAYQRLVNKAQSVPAGDERTIFLFDFVYAPIFRGSGFQDPEDETSPWIDGLSVWCEPIRLGIALEREAGFHIPSWKRIKETEKGVNLGYVALGGLTLFGAWKLFRWSRGRR